MLAVSGPYHSSQWRFEIQREGVHHLRPQEMGYLLYGALGEEADPGLKVGDSGGEGSGVGLD